MLSFFFFSSRRRHTRFKCDWSSDVCSSDLINGAKVSRSQLLVAFPQYTQVNITDVPIGGQSYHSLQMKLARRFSQGIGIHAAYTISKTLERVSILNPQDVNLSVPTKTSLEQRRYQFDT